ncbi:MAG: hypothetical protein JNJ45_12420 [Chthonomonas sp.]|nr:hypothetical protein [Chthonomonas sp.]
MIALTLPLLLLQQDKPAETQQTPGQFLSKVIFRYAEAKTIQGSFKCVSTANGLRVEVNSAVAIERPSKVYLRQVRGGAVPEDTVITSDGKKFSYDAPIELKNTRGERLMEFVWKEGAKAPMSVGEVVQIGQQRLPDYSAPLWLMMSYRIDLEFLRGCWGKVAWQQESNGLLSVGGTYKEYPLATEAGTWQLWATPEGDLKRYALSVPIVEGGRQITVSNVWTIDVKLNAEVAPETFKLKF